MKRFRFFAILAIVSMLATSCEMFGENGLLGNKKARFVAHTESEVRTTMGEGHTVLWSEGDAIAIIGVSEDHNDADFAAFLLTEGAGTTSGVFEGDLKQKYENYYAYYPAERIENGYTGGQFIVTYPSDDAVYTEQNFVDRANPMIAYGNEKDGLHFKNLCGILELKLTGSGEVTHISVESGHNDPCISGKFIVNAPTCETFPTDQSARHITASLVQPITLSQSQSRSIYAILPPGEYNDLRITTYDNLGNATTRLAKNTIKVERSVITPVSEFDHETVEVPHISVAIIEEQSNFATTTYRATMNNLAAGASRVLLSENGYNDYISKGLTDIQIIEQGGSAIAQSGTYRVNTENFIGQKLVFLFAPYDEQGNWGAVQKLNVTVKNVPIDPSYSISVKGTPVVTSSSLEIFFDAAPAEGAFRGYIVDNATLADWNANNYELCTAKLYDIELPYGGSEVHLIRTQLTPDTEYTLLYRVTSGVSDGIAQDTHTAYSEYKTYTFKTEAYELSKATVDLTIKEIKDWSITVALAGSNATKYKLYASTGEWGTDMDIENTLDINGIEVSGTATEYTFGGLTEGTTYYIYAIAYDASGAYGQHSTITATTNPTIAPEPNSEYDKFIGTYTFTSSSTGAGEGRTVTISKGIEGKTFHVKGLLNPVLISEQYGVVDDTIVARFFDGMIHLGGTAIADKGTTLPCDYLYASIFSSAGYYWPGASISSLYNDGTLIFANISDPQFTGLLFHLGNVLGENQQNMDYYTDLVLIKQGEGGGNTRGNSTESFQLNNNVVDAGWR